MRDLEIIILTGCAFILSLIFIVFALIVRDILEMRREE